MTEVYLLFYQTALQTFVHFNMFLQREDPVIPVIYEQTNSFLQKLASKFLTVQTIKAANGNYTTLQFKEPAVQHEGNIEV